MVKFEDSLNTFTLGKEGYAQERYNKQAARIREACNHPVNVRYREILGKMATALTRQGNPLEPYTLGVGVRYGMDYADNMDWLTEDSVYTHGWGLSLKPRYAGGRPPHMHSGGTSPSIGSSDRQPYYNYLFLKHDGRAADRRPGTRIVPVEEASEELVAQSNLVMHKNILHVAIDDGLTSNLVHTNEGTSGGYRLHNGEIVYAYKHDGKDHQFSFEENLAALLASKIAE